MTFKELKNTNQISNECYEVCMLNSIHSLTHLKEYYLRNGSFRELNSCGTEVIREFLKLLNFREGGKYINSFLPYYKGKKASLLVNFVEKSQISRRTYNICHANGIETIRELEFYYKQFKTFRYLSRYGVKSNKELLALIKQVRKE